MRVWELGAGWGLGARHWMLLIKSSELGAESRELGTGSMKLNTGSCCGLDAGSWELGAENRDLGAGSWVSEYWGLDRKLRNAKAR